jgi:hypothetical protein
LIRIHLKKLLQSQADWAQMAEVAKSERFARTSEATKPDDPAVIIL